MKTWKIEMLVVGAILLAVNFFTHHLCSVEMLAALAVLLTFGHAQIADRMARSQATMDKPTVECYRKMWYYFAGKEICWFLYFFMTRSYSALVGVIVFLLYPIWRMCYRDWKEMHPK